MKLIKFTDYSNSNRRGIAEIDGLHRPMQPRHSRRASELVHALVWTAATVAVVVGLWRLGS